MSKKKKKSVKNIPKAKKEVVLKKQVEKPVVKEVVKKPVAENPVAEKPVEKVKAKPEVVRPPVKKKNYGRRSVSLRIKDYQNRLK